MKARLEKELGKRVEQEVKKRLADEATKQTKASSKDQAARDKLIKVSNGRARNKYGPVAVFGSLVYSCQCFGSTSISCGSASGSSPKYHCGPNADPDPDLFIT